MNLPPIHRLLAPTSLALGLCASSTLADDDFGRGGKWSLSAGAQYLTSDTATTEIAGINVGVRLESVIGGGIGLGYDISDHFTLGVDVWGGGGTIKGEALNIETSTSATVLGGNLALDWNILKSRFTPLLSANLGFMTLSGDVADVPMSETDLTFGVGAGVRWDISDRWFAKAVYRMNWTEFSGFDELTLVHGATVSVGFRF